MNQKEFYEEQLTVSKQSSEWLKEIRNQLIALTITTKEIYKTKEGEHALEELNVKISKTLDEANK